MSIFNAYQARFEAAREEEMSLQEYLELCRKDRMAYASAAERMLQAIGEPELVDTRLDPRLSRIFSNKIIRLYPAFRDFYGMEEAIEKIVSYFRHAAQGLEEKKQILYLLGPVGGGKSSLAERLKKLMEQQPIYTLAVGGKISPVFESPLGLFHPDRMAGRILGMGDMLTLIEKAEAVYEEQEAEIAAQKLMEGQFTLDDFLDQMQQLKKMGPLNNVLSMMPGLPKEMKDVEIGDREVGKVEAIIRSMTREERTTPSLVNGSRRQRIALGSGTSISDVNLLLKQFDEMQKMMKQMGGLGRRMQKRVNKKKNKRK